MFNAVSLDMKLEQTIQRSQKSSKGIIGQTRRNEYVTEWQLIYHEVFDISNMEHMETYHHELIGRKSEQFDENVTRLLKFIEAKGNPFDVNQTVNLHNFVIMYIIDHYVKEKILNVIGDGEDSYILFRHERYISKEKKILDEAS